MRRQAWEQYRTSSQFFAQARRQVMGRPHTAQGLLGKCALLPRCPLIWLLGFMTQNCTE
ncbi:hypothetical protein GWL_45730 [Herbaspirillum sp. GW103]|nr:hypothetical protein GWL_45730 [Herbaspirillum sp. GW103]